jgi:hypothetical protein
MAQEKGWPGASQHRVGKLEKAHKALEKEHKGLEKAHHELDKGHKDLKGRVDKFEKENSFKAIVLALKDIAAAIRESSGGGTGITQAMIDQITAQVLANKEKIQDAQGGGDNP